MLSHTQFSMLCMGGWDGTQKFLEHIRLLYARILIAMTAADSAVPDAASFSYPVCHLYPF